jgi:hypothetical protein
MINGDCFVSIHLGRPATWIIKQNDIYPIPMKSVAHWKVLSPLLHETLGYGRDSDYGKPFIVGVGNNYALLKSAYIVFIVPNIEHLQIFAPKNTKDKLSYFLEIYMKKFSSDYMKKLKYVTKQAGLPTETGYGLTISRRTHISPEFPKASSGNTKITSNFDIETAITAKSLQMADKISSKSSILIYDSLILDSIQALVEGDFRRTILFAAIAMETYVATVLENAYSEYLLKNNNNPRIRIVDNILKGGETKKTDPVFSYLSERSKNDFSLLLNQIPLYIVGKSLLKENEGLYTKAICLYKTRNKIVHRGIVPEDESNLLNLNFKDATTGIQTALNVCSWFGLKEHYSIPSRKHTSLRKPE